MSSLRPTVIGAIMHALAHRARHHPRHRDGTDGAPCEPAFEATIAQAEGWDVVHCGPRDDGFARVEIQRLDSPDNGPPVFASDAEAWTHVVTRARQGSAFHLRALDRVDRAERLLIEVSCGRWTDTPS